MNRELESLENLDMDGVLDVIKDFPWKPFRGKLIVTSNVVHPEFGEGADFSEVRFDEVQYVIAIADNLKGDLQPGQKVLLDLESMMIQVEVDNNSQDKTGYLKLDPIHVGDRTYVLVSERFVKCIANG